MEKQLGLKDITQIIDPLDFIFAIIKMPKKLKKLILFKTNTKGFTTGITIIESSHTAGTIITKGKNRG